jgi:hypothetical protein
MSLLKMYSKFAFEFNNKVRIRFEKLLGVLNTILKKLLNINADVENQANYGVSVRTIVRLSSINQRNFC